MSRSMKDSGVEWIGEIPVEWDLKTVGKLFHNRNEKVSDYDFEPLSVTKNGIVPQLDSAAKSDNHNDRKKVCIDDFVINSRSDRKMSAGLSSLEGSVSLINLVLYSDKIFPNYSNYLLKNYGFAEEFYRWGTGIVADLWSTRYERMKRISIPYPSIREQQKIATFLDDKTTQIDSILMDTKQSIVELKKYKQALISETVTKGLNPDIKMKDSGIEWVGGIPEHWNVVKLGRLIISTMNGITRRNNTNENIGSVVLRLKDISNNGIEYDNVNRIELSETEMKRYALKHGDLLFVRVNGSKHLVGKNTLFMGYPEIVAYNDHIIKVTISEKILPTYTKWYLQSDSGGNEVQQYIKTSAGQFTISGEDLRKLKIALPQLMEQQQIADFLDEKTAHIDSLIADKEKMVQELGKYKKSLIYEYVTGKKEV